MTSPVLSSSDVATVVADRLPDSLPPELVAKMDAAGITADDRQQIVQASLDGQNAVQEGDPLGTVRRDDATGILHIRVNCGAVHKWRVIDPNTGDANDFDMQPISYPVVVEAWVPPPAPAPEPTPTPVPDPTPVAVSKRDALRRGK